MGVRWTDIGVEEVDLVTRDLVGLLEHPTLLGRKGNAAFQVKIIGRL